MNWIKIYRQGSIYISRDSSTSQMEILGNFLTDDVSCGLPSLTEWWLSNNDFKSLSCNATHLEKICKNVCVTSLYDSEDSAVELRMTLKQFADIILAWQERVCRTLPQEVLITYENDEYIITVVRQ